MATVTHLFRNNATLCANISDRVVSRTLTCIDRQGRQPEFLQFLRSVIKVNDIVQRCVGSAPVWLPRLRWSAWGTDSAWPGRCCWCPFPGKRRR